MAIKAKRQAVAISFEKVRTTDKHVDALYALLKWRKHTISHRKMPSRQAHRKFIANHPYRVWYLVKAGDEYVGSIYLLDNNCIGVNIAGADAWLIPDAIEYVLTRHKPLPAVKSVRAADFHVNLAPSNRELKSALKKMGATLLQTTYSLAPLASK
jgi:hypothetical protein